MVRVEPHLADESLNLSRACDRFPENLLFIINCCEENVYDEYFLFLDFGGSPFNLNLSSVSGVMYFWPMRSRRRSTDNSKYRVIFFSGKFYRSRFAFIFFAWKTRATSSLWTVKNYLIHRSLPPPSSKCLLTLARRIYYLVNIVTNFITKPQRDAVNYDAEFSFIMRSMPGSSSNHKRHLSRWQLNSPSFFFRFRDVGGTGE